MQEFKLPWGQWHEQSTRKIRFPDEWEIHYCSLAHYPALTEQEIEERIDKPIDCSKLEELSANKHSACIVMDDISRPTPGYRILPIIIRKLVKAGMDINKITVLLAVGGHRPLTRQEMKCKVGEWVINHVQVINHSPFASNLVTIPDDEQVIRVNQYYMQADLKLAVGCVVPHNLAGFSGGAKAIVPGICGIETLRSNHTLAFNQNDSTKSFIINTCNPNNPIRKNIESVVGKIGLDYICNVILNDEMQIADVFTGNFVTAHRLACEAAMSKLRTPLIKNADILVCSAYPKDTEYSQIATCFNVLGSYAKECVKNEGTIIAMTASSDGAGYHAIFGPGMSLFVSGKSPVPC